MIENELISIIMSVYNEEINWIKEAVDSILNQTYQNFEFIIVIDNPNNKEIKDILETYKVYDSRINLIINKKNDGLVKSLNTALQHCSGKYIARMDADDISLENRLEIQKQYLETEALDFVFSGIKVIDEHSHEVYESNENEIEANKIKKLLNIIHCTYHPTWFVKSEVYKNLRGYRQIPYCEDYDFALRSISKDYKIGKIGENLLKYRVRNNGISKSYSLEQFLNMKVILKLYKRKQLEQLDSINNRLERAKKMANKKAKINFNKSNDLYAHAVKIWKNNKKIEGLFYFVLSCLRSRHYLIKYKDLVKYKFFSNFL